MVVNPKGWKLIKNSIGRENNCSHKCNIKVNTVYKWAWSIYLAIINYALFCMSSKSESIQREIWWIPDYRIFSLNFKARENSLLLILAMNHSFCFLFWMCPEYDPNWECWTIKFTISIMILQLNLFIKTLFKIPRYPSPVEKSQSHNITIQNTQIKHSLLHLETFKTKNILRSDIYISQITSSNTKKILNEGGWLHPLSGTNPLELLFITKKFNIITSIFKYFRWTSPIRSLPTHQHPLSIIVLSQNTSFIAWTKTQKTGTIFRNMVRNYKQYILYAVSRHHSSRKHVL